MEITLIECRGHGGDQLAHVCVLRMVQNGVGRSGFDDLAVLHNCDAIGYAAHGVQIVADKEDGQIQAAPQAKEGLENVRLYVGVECGDCFVCNEQTRLGRDGTRDGHALALPTREGEGLSGG